MAWPNPVSINFGSGPGAGDGETIYSALTKLTLQFNILATEGVASTATAVTGTDTTQPVHSAGVKAAIEARLVADETEISGGTY